jgi:Tol biopolymer transport system component
MRKGREARAVCRLRPQVDGSMRRGRLPTWIVTLLFVPVVACTTAPTQSIRSPPVIPTGSSSFGSPAEVTIAFHSDPGGRDDTYVMNGTGTSTIAITDGMETVAEPYWSPDGARLVVSCCTSGAGGHLFLIDGPGTEPVDLAPDVAGATNPAWSPDGSEIAFESVDDGSLYVVDMRGSEPGAARPLHLSGAGPSWSPDGQRIAYFADRRGAPDIFTANAEGTDIVRLTRDAAPDYSPAWSADGRIAFVSERDGDQDVFVMAADGSDQIDVSRNPWPDDFPAWSPQGRLLAYVAYQDGADPLTIGDGDADIFVVAADGSHRRNVTHNPAWDGDPSWSPDGAEIAFTRRAGHAQVLVVRPNGSSQRRLRGVDGTANDCCPAWRP